MRFYEVVVNPKSQAIAKKYYIEARSQREALIKLEYDLGEVNPAFAITIALANGRIVK